MQIDSNDCLAFSISPTSTNYTLSEYQQERSQLDEESFSLQKLQSAESIEIDIQSSSLEIDTSDAKKEKEQQIEDSVFKFFKQKGIVQSSPQEIWASHNRDLQKRTYQIIQNRNDCNISKKTSSLLHKRLQKTFTLSV